MPNKRYRILAGFSGNPMEVWRVPSLAAVQGQKVLVDTADARWTIGGTTFNLIEGFNRLSSEIDCRGLITVSATSDPARDMLAQITTERGYDCRLFPCRTATSRAVVIQEEDGTTTILGRKPTYLNQPLEEIREEVERFSPDIVIASGVVPDDVGLVNELFTSAKTKSATCVLNPRRELITEDRPMFEQLARVSDLLVINDVEAAALFECREWRYREPFEETLADDLAMLERLGVRETIVTCSSDGAVYLSTNSTTLERDAIDLGPVFETTGAGDSFLAGFLTARCEGRNVAESMDFASVVAGIKVTKREPGMPDRENVNAVLARL